MNKKYIRDFKELRISKKELIDKLGENLISSTTDDPVVINTADVINVLTAFKIGKIALDQLLDWVNTIWFTDLFDYNDDQCDSIASVLDQLEELDEESKELTESDINKYINALLENKEV
jgi:hypothetical protein